MTPQQTLSQLLDPRAVEGEAMRTDEIQAYLAAWVCGPDDGDGNEDEKVEVTFQDGSTRTFNKGVTLRQIWHEYAD